MATIAVQYRRGTTLEHSTFTGLVGEFTVDTSKNTGVVHDGSTAGGFPLQKEITGSANLLFSTGTYADPAWLTSLDYSKLSGTIPIWNQNTTGTASNVTGVVLPAKGGTGLTALGAGVATFLGTPTSANLAATVTDETGTGTIVFSNAPTITGLKEIKSALTANNIDLSLGNYFTKTISGATTLTVSNVPATGTVPTFIFDITNGGSAVITWWAGLKWAAGTSPILTAAGRDLLGFFTHDGGTTWNGLVLSKDMK
jgi:hypothetical protein